MSFLRLLSIITLASCVSCIDLTFFGLPQFHVAPEPNLVPEIVEVVRWRQPICLVPSTGISPCSFGFHQFQKDYEQSTANGAKSDEASGKTLLTGARIHERISLDEIEPSTVGQEEIRERAIEPTPTLDDGSDRDAPRRARFFSGRIFVGHKQHQPIKPLPIYVTKVINSPVTATLVAHNCLPDIGIPLCEDYRSPQKLLCEQTSETHTLESLHDEKPVESIAATNGSEDNFNISAAAEANAGTQVNDIEENLEDKNEENLRAVIDTKDAVVQAIFNASAHKHEDIIDKKESIEAKKQLALEGLVNKTQSLVHELAEKKHSIAQEIDNKKRLILQSIVGKIQSIVREIVDKKQSLDEKKHSLLMSIVNKTRSIVRSIADKKQQLDETKLHALHGVVKGIEDKKQHIVDDLTWRKESVVQAIANVKVEKEKIVQGLVNKTQDIVQSIIDKKTKFDLDVATKKQNIVENIADTKGSVIKHVADKTVNAIKSISNKTQEIIGSVSAAKPILLSTLQQHLGLAKNDTERATEDPSRIVFDLNEKSPSNPMFDERSAGRERLSENQDDESKKLQYLDAARDSNKDLDAEPSPNTESTNFRDDSDESVELDA